MWFQLHLNFNRLCYVESKPGEHAVNFEKLFKTVDALMAVRDAAKEITGKADAQDSSVPQAPSSGPGGQIETRLTNVLVAALKEAFDRDHARLELERAQMQEERRRAEETARVELRRQALDREIGRLRLLGGTALVGWIVSVMLLVRRAGNVTGASQITLGVGCLLLLGSIGAAFSAQGRLNSYVAEPDYSSAAERAGAGALWLLLGGLALSAASLLF
jgi:hypothetical protein